jgi:hypothetical protein
VADQPGERLDLLALLGELGASALVVSRGEVRARGDLGCPAQATQEALGVGLLAGAALGAPGFESSERLLLVGAQRLEQHHEEVDSRSSGHRCGAA